MARDLEITDVTRQRWVGAESGGRIEIVRTAPQGSHWFLDRLVVRTSSVADTSLRVYVGAEADENLVDGTDTGNLDVADQNSAIYVPAGEDLRFVWTDATAGSRGSVNAQIRTASYKDTSRSMRGQTEEIPYGMDLPPVKRKVTQGYGGGGW